MRLHPVTWLVIFAIAIRLASDCVITAVWVHDFTQLRSEPYGSNTSPWLFITPRLREFAVTIGYVTMAVMVEGLARVSRALRKSRTQGSKAAS